VLLAVGLLFLIVSLSYAEGPAARPKPRNVSVTKIEIKKKKPNRKTGFLSNALNGRK